MELEGISWLWLWLGASAAAIVITGLLYVGRLIYEILTQIKRNDETF